MLRFALVGFLGLTLLLLGVSGVHEHHSPTHATQIHDAHDAHDAHAEHSPRAFAWFDAHHEVAHEEAGDVDVKAPATVSGKPSIAKWLAALSLTAVLYLIVSRAGALILAALPPLRPPKPRRHLYSLLPPGHAPPLAV
jgi:hypothetical protein